MAQPVLNRLHHFDLQEKLQVLDLPAEPIFTGLRLHTGEYVCVQCKHAHRALPADGRESNTRTQNATPTIQFSHRPTG